MGIAFSSFYYNDSVNTPLAWVDLTLEILDE